MIFALDKAFPESRREDEQVDPVKNLWISRWYYWGEYEKQIFVEKTYFGGANLLHGSYKIWDRNGKLALQYLFQNGCMVVE